MDYTFEQLQSIRLLITDLFLRDGYIKGHGKKLCRVMDKDHNPLYNFDRQIIMDLLNDDTLIQDGLVYRLKIKPE